MDILKALKGEESKLLQKGAGHSNRYKYSGRQQQRQPGGTQEGTHVGCGKSTDIESAKGKMGGEKES